MNQDFSIVHLLLNASWVVQLVVLLLLGVSVASWAAIFRKVLALKRVNQLNDDFERDFWSGKSLNELFSAATQNAKLAGPMERIFASGMREYQKLRERRITDSSLLMDGARRAMRASFQREMDAVESNLTLLASAGSAAQQAARGFGQRGEAVQAGVGQGDEPLDLDLHAAVHQAVLRQQRAQGGHLGGITAVERRQGGQRGKRHDGKAWRSHAGDFRKTGILPFTHCLTGR